ncbi:hypothetical protein [Nostoc sp. DSM 114167]|jgi:hypothetical protein|uniref:hypothetical protein n=1 Tax=Nostoc sp. DSM 114167 TaxID=3439050 RepID=UPI0040466F9D
MNNVNGLTQLNNQEAILEEINEDELEGVVGGLGIVGGILVGGLGASPDAVAGLNGGLKTTLDSLVDILI